ncbi:hypothetical protein [Litchfieldella xinjiangensis]|uniref:hypothetical protein n=1 Tax=Litchfieldella xinjiangensis TaxID=1166948 RepID=UPI0005BB3EC5|nr:hypothetical protein [Halomonas xinjiangensis]
MAYCSESRPSRATPALQICDTSSVAVRLAWEASRDATQLSDDEQLLQALQREEAVHDMFRRRFLRITERYLKGELG